MDTSLDLDALVRLAAIGCSGVAVLAISLGFLLIKSTANAGESVHRTVRLYLYVSAFVALVSGLSGILNFTTNSSDVADAEQSAEEATTRAEEAEATQLQLRSAFNEMERKLKEPNVSVEQFKTILGRYKFASPADRIPPNFHGPGPR